MSELTGEDAFDKVLDRLLDETKKQALDAGQLVEARNASRIAANEVMILQKQVKVLSDDAARALPKLDELWSAAETLSSKLTTHLGDLGMTDKVLSEERARLTLALSAARSICQMIQF